MDSQSLSDNPQRLAFLTELAGFLSAYLPTTDWGLDLIDRINLGQQGGLEWGFGGFRRKDFVSMAKAFGISVGHEGEEFHPDNPVLASQQLFEVFYQQGRFDVPEAPKAAPVEGYETFADMPWPEIMKLAHSAGISIKDGKESIIAQLEAMEAPKSEAAA